MPAETRPVPTPPATRTRPAQIPTRAAHDRHRWEAAVLASEVHRNSRTIALVLSHYADDAGYLPPGGPQDVLVLAEAAGMSGKNVRLSLRYLENRGFIRRPTVTEWAHQDAVRPITLTLPRAFTRPVPARPGETER